MIRPLLLIVVLSMLAGCTSHNHVSPEQESLAALQLQHWPAEGQARGVILGLHSFGDSGEAFNLIGPLLAHAGYHLYSFDQAGFGQRQLEGRWAGEQTLVTEASEQARYLSEKHNMPVYLLGESLGGAVALLSAAQSQDSIAGLILAAPAVREGIRLRYGWNALIASAAAIWPGYLFEVERPPDNPDLAAAAAQRLATAPGVMRQVRLDSYWGLIRIADSASDRAADINLPSLLLYGGRDNAVPEVGIRRLRAHLNEQGRYRYYPDGPHFLLQGHNVETVGGDIIEWLESQRRPVVTDRR